MSVLRKYSDVPDQIDLLSKSVVDAVFHVHSNLGAGFLERIYEDCLCLELQERGIAFERQFPISVVYKGHKVTSDFKVDLVVEKAILLELKAVEKWNPVYDSQIYFHLKMSGIPLGFLINFNVPLIKEGIRRFVNKDLRPLGSSRDTLE